ncbi:prominin [Clonorchis sinensis]|uniref:Prominin n=1 Tax=Clonorchis sinensis TaxID=79923 RepID=G7YJK5_CLOSI|nr:prominin [Clonorchis sinensis]
MPLIGLIFCCARCCGRCGGRVHQMDAKKDPCRRVAYTICVVIIVTIQLVAIVLAFINHFLLHEAMVNPDSRLGTFSKLNESLADTEKALDDMYKMAVNTSSVDLSTQKNRFLSIVDGNLKEFQKEFVRKSHAELVLTPIAELQSNTDCPWGNHVECTQLLHLAQSNLKTRYTMEQYQSEELKTLVEQIQRHLNEVENLNEFNKTLNSLASVIKATIQDDLDRAWTDLAQSPATREKLARSFEDYLQHIYTYLRQARQRLAMDGDQDARNVFIRFVEFRFYGGIALLCIPVLIFLLIYLGLCFGTCGHRPHEEAGVCNRGVGANLLLAGVGFIFLFSTVLMLICTILFVLGGPIQTEVCRYLTGHVPDGPRKLDDYLHHTMQYMIDKIRREGRIRQQEEELRRAKYGDPTIVIHSEMSPHLEVVLNISRARLLDAVLTRCANEPFVDAISGGQIVWPVLHEPIQSILENLINAYKDTNLVAPLDQTVQICVSALERTNFLDSVNFTQAINQADLSVTKIDDLEGFVSSLRKLKAEALNPHIDELVQKVVRLDKARAQARHLYTKLDSIPGQRQQLRLQLSEFSRKLAESVQLTMDVGLKNLRPLLEHELQLAVIATWRDIPCQSLRSAVKGGVDAVCVMPLMPLNAFWAGLGLTLWLFIPLIIFAVKLASLYRKTEKYSSDYEEPKPRNKLRKHKDQALRFRISGYIYSAAENLHIIQYYWILLVNLSWVIMLQINTYGLILVNPKTVRIWFMYGLEFTNRLRTYRGSLVWLFADSDLWYSTHDPTQPITLRKFSALDHDIVLLMCDRLLSGNTVVGVLDPCSWPTYASSFLAFVWFCKDGFSRKSVDWHTEHVTKPSQLGECDQFVYRGRVISSANHSMYFIITDPVLRRQDKIKKNTATATKVVNGLSPLNESLALSLPGPLATKKVIQPIDAAIKTTTASLMVVMSPYALESTLAQPAVTSNDSFYSTADPSTAKGSDAREVNPIAIGNVKLPVSSSTLAKVSPLIVSTVVAHDPDSQSHRRSNNGLENPPYIQFVTLSAGDSGVHTNLKWTAAAEPQGNNRPRVEGKILHWIKAFLSDRTFRVNVGLTYSSTAPNFYRYFHPCWYSGTGATIFSRQTTNVRHLAKPTALSNLLLQFKVFALISLAMSLQAGNEYQNSWDFSLLLFITDKFAHNENPVTHSKETKDLGLRYTCTFSFFHQVQFQVARAPLTNIDQKGQSFFMPENVLYASTRKQHCGAPPPDLVADNPSSFSHVLHALGVFFSSR